VFAASHQICASGLLQSSRRRSVLQPRALRRRPLRLRVPVRASRDMYENTLAEGFGSEDAAASHDLHLRASAATTAHTICGLRRWRTLIKKDFEDCFARGINAILTPRAIAAFGFGEKVLARHRSRCTANDFHGDREHAFLPGIRRARGQGQRKVCRSACPLNRAVPSTKRPVFARRVIEQGCWPLHAVAMVVTMAHLTSHVVNAVPRTASSRRRSPPSGGQPTARGCRHKIVQVRERRHQCAWVHAYLTRSRADLSNAGTGIARPTSRWRNDALDAEWQRIVDALEKVTSHELWTSCSFWSRGHRRLEVVIGLRSMPRSLERQAVFRCVDRNSAVSPILTSRWWLLRGRACLPFHQRACVKQAIRTGLGLNAGSSASVFDRTTISSDLRRAIRSPVQVAVSWARAR